MLKRAFSFLMITLFLISTVTVAFNIQATARAIGPLPTYSLSGTVRDKLGNPAPNVLIVAQDALTEVEVASVTSDSAGAYAMSVPPSTYNLIITPPPESGFANTAISNIEVTADIIMDIVLVPAESVTFGGEVVDRDGNPVPNQQVALYSSAIGNKYVFTDAQGLFSLNVPTGIYQLEMYGGNSAPNVPYSYCLVRYSLNFTEDTFMTITLPTRYLTGTVVDPDGNPVADVSVSARSEWVTFGDFQGYFEAHATSDSEGKFNLTVFTCPQVSLVATPPSESPYGAVLILVNATEDSSVTVTLVPPVTFGGEVVDRDGNPVPNQQVALYSSAIGNKYVFTDAQGLFSLNVPTGIYQLEMYGGNSAPNVPYSYCLVRYSLNFTEDTFMTITLPTRYLTGKVDIEGNPVADVSVSARSEWVTFGDFQGYFEAHATSDSEGKFNLTVFTCSSVSLTTTPPPESPLAATNIANIDMTRDKTVLIALFYKAGVLPTANFTWTPETPEAGQSIAFDASSSTPGTGIIIRHKWNFGDGTYAIGKIVTHSYASPGVYTVTLNVTNSKGLWDIEQKQIQVIEQAGPKPPVASFTYTPANPVVDQEATFDASTSYDLDGEIVSYVWNFGDGSTGEGKAIIHSYVTEGNYRVELTVFDNDGKSSSTSETVTVVKPVTPPVTASGLNIKAMSPVDLIVIDPDYLVISKDFSEIPNAVYMEIDLNGDGSLDDYIFIPEPKTGQYLITVVPQFGADPAATYTLEVSTENANFLLAEHVSINDIPTEPYILHFATYSLADVTKDGLVDIFDLVTVVIAFGSTPSIPSWDARCDLNEDSVIDILDLSIVALNFGKEQTPP